MKKEWLLFACMSLATLAVALGLLRWFAPRLLGAPPDLQLVQVEEALPPFFEGVFRAEDHTGDDFILPDPYLLRARPFFPDTGRMGPNDLLGFRNRGVPNYADIVVIGDSQTYGNNASIEHNWPSQMRAVLEKEGRQAALYNMSVGGWGGAHYLEVFPKALYFRPRVVVVAFYTGNDPLESFFHVYGNDRWADLRIDPSLGKGDSPKGRWRQIRREKWEVSFADGVDMSFTPRRRTRSNQDHPAVDTGYAIMAEAARRIGGLARERGCRLVLTIIPTKELVYAPKVAAAGMTVPEIFTQLVEHEAERIRTLRERLEAIEGASYVDVVTPLQQAALGRKPLYKAGSDGHPVAAGYRVIGTSVAAAVKPALHEPIQGAALVEYPGGDIEVALVHDEGLWFFPSRQAAKAAGLKPKELPRLKARDVAHLPYGGTIDRLPPTAEPLGGG